jgi:hypothetical protein
MGHQAQTRCTARNFLMFHTIAVRLTKYIHCFFVTEEDDKARFDSRWYSYPQRGTRFITVNHNGEPTSVLYPQRGTSFSAVTHSGEPTSALLAHSSPSGRFWPDKIADFLSLVNHVCALLKVDTAIGLYLCYQLKKTEQLYHIYNSF